MPYDFIDPGDDTVPILVSVPHSGTEIPNDLADRYDPRMINHLDDTDWFVDRLYDFVTERGIPMIRARYSRWVIDLNRQVENQSLYDDGRVITALCPSTDFNGNPLYRSKGPDETEINRRIRLYYKPYYQKITEVLAGMRTKYDHVLFYDAHSIRNLVPGIRPDAFPDLILGDVDNTSAHTQIIRAAVDCLSTTDYSFRHNEPFKGGNLTRTFGDPKNGVHALQLEMSKLLYMEDAQMDYHDNRASAVRAVLTDLFDNLVNVLDHLNR